MATMQIQLYEYAITLNNIGCYLLQAGAAKQAHEIFRDAIDTLRVTCCPRVADCDHIGQQDLLNKAYEKVKRASSKALSPVRMGKLASVELLCWDDLDISCTRSLSMAPSDLGDECCVAFSISTAFYVQQRDHELDSCIMLHNYGLAHVALMNTGNARQVNRTALSLFRMSFSVLYRKIQEGIEDDIWDMDTPVESITGLTIAILRNLVNTLLVEGLKSEAQACQKKLLEIVEALSTVEEVQSAYLLPIATAAAA
eukprot:scaffold1549_cov156-Amphora_coffeaeformis.AAC.2